MNDMASIPFVGEFRQVEGHLPGGAWVTKLREAALARIGEQGFPTRRNEHWKYTDVSALLKAEFIPAPLASMPEAFFQGVQRFELDCHQLVFLNGVFRPNLSSNSLPAGLTVKTLAAAIEEDAEALQPFLARERDSAFAALNTAFMHEGVLIEAAPGTVLEKPLHLVFLSAAHEPQPVVTHPRIIVRAGRAAALRFIESHLGLEGARNFTNVVTDVLAEQGAQVRQLRLIEAAADESHIANIHAELRRDAVFVNHQVCIGGKLVRNDIRVDLVEENASVALNGLVLANGSEHVDNHLDVRHMAPRTQSDQAYRCILDGRARAVFNGRVYIAPRAQKIEANQASNNLLLSKLAEIDTKPELEIYADDVKCSHGATVGQLDENMLFYLRSRGVDADTARSLLIYAFADEIIRRIGIASVRAAVEAAVLGRLPDADSIRHFTMEAS
ncbi:MAG TPA: Fe-S cluster assembly protein SufD [Gammaproteobacteria bacterium]|nr:Fe-S cluster assembly protein SufD [Gammaproteobacteria bacterium]